jgi:putative copper export protein
MLQGAGVALLLVGLLLVGRARPRTGWALAAAAGVIVALGGALAGHARTEGGWLPVAVQTLHAGAAAVWAGGVAALVLAAIPAARRAPESLARFVGAFSPIALAAVAVLLLTGVINAWDRVGGIGELVSSGYGRVLLVKLALVAGAAAFGLHNRRTVLPALAEQPRAGLIRVPASVELLLQTLVLLATAFLVVLPPSGLTAP